MWNNVREGRSAVGYTTAFDASNFPTKISAEVRNWTIADAGEDPRVWEYRGKHSKFAAGAAKQAVAESGILDAKLDPTRLGVYLGSGEGHQDFDCFTRMMIAALDGERLDMAKFTKASLEMLHPASELEQEPNMPAGHLASLAGNACRRVVRPLYCTADAALHKRRRRTPFGRTDRMTATLRVPPGPAAAGQTPDPSEARATMAELHGYYLDDLKVGILFHLDAPSRGDFAGIDNGR